MEEELRQRLTDALERLDAAEFTAKRNEQLRAQTAKMLEIVRGRWHDAAREVDRLTALLIEHGVDP